MNIRGQKFIQSEMNGWLLFSEVCSYFFSEETGLLLKELWEEKLFYKLKDFV